MFWVALNNGQREIIETDGGVPPSDENLIVLGGFITHEEAETKMNEGRQRSTSWR